LTGRGWRVSRCSWRVPSTWAVEQTKAKKKNYLTKIEKSIYPIKTEINQPNKNTPVLWRAWTVIWAHARIVWAAMNMGNLNRDDNGLTIHTQLHINI